MITKTVIVSIGDEWLEFDYPCPKDMEEDEVYERVIEYVFSNITVEVEG